MLRLAAIIAVVLAALTVVAAAYAAVRNFPRGLILGLLVIAASASAWYGLLRAGPPRLAGVGVAALLLWVAVVWVIVAVVLQAVGRRRLAEIEPLPQTKATLKEDVEWAKAQTS
jgi:cell division protein FtsL